MTYKLRAFQQSEKGRSLIANARYRDILKGRRFRKLRETINAFCPTGKGGGRDNSCSSRKGSRLPKLVVTGDENDWRTNHLRGILQRELGRVAEALPGLAEKLRQHPCKVDLDDPEMLDERGEMHYNGLYDFGNNRIVMRSKGAEGHVNLKIGTDFAVAHGPRATYLHELGHHVDHLSKESDSGFMDVVFQEMRNQGLDPNRGSRRREWLQASISGYAGTSMSEAFAEAFTAYTHADYGKKGGRLPRQIEAYFDRLLKTPAANAFCPTGPGGGVDPTCSPKMGGGRRALRTSDDVKTLDDLREFTRVLQGPGLYTHATRWHEGIDKILAEGVKAGPDGVSTTDTQVKPRGQINSHKVRDLGSGFVVIDGQGLKKRKMVDVVAADEKYPETRFLESIPRDRIVKAVRVVRDANGQTDSELNIAEYALANQGLDDAEVRALPEKYQRWFHLNKPTTNARRKPANPLRLDPSHTGQIRKRFEADMARRFDDLKKRLWKLVIEEDALGLRGTGLSENAWCATGEGCGRGNSCSSRPTVSQLLAVLNGDCGTGAGGFKPGNTCAKGGGIISDIHMIDPRKTRDGNPKDPPFDVHVNPTRDDVKDVLDKSNGRIRVLVKQKDVDGPEVVVWPADAGMHDVVMSGLGIEPDRKRRQQGRSAWDYDKLIYDKDGMNQFDEWYRWEGDERVKPIIAVIKAWKPKAYESPLKQFLTENTGRWAFLTSSKRLEEFVKWFKVQLMGTVLESVHPDNLATDAEPGESWLTKYIRQAYKKSLETAHDLMKPTGMTMLPTEAGRAYQAGGKAEFMRQAFNGPAGIERLRQLAGRAYDDLDGISTNLSNKISRQLLDGMVKGESPRAVGRRLNKMVDGYKNRGLAIARTETLRAHNEGQLDGMEALGATHVGAQVEWSTSGLGMTGKGNPSPCKLCAELQGVVLTIQEARGLLPRHPNCMCAWRPANVGESTKGQIRRQDQIKAALERSLRLGKPKKAKHSLKEEAQRATWPGGRAKISKTRPKTFSIKK